ncbi:dihydrouridine synthase [Desulfonema ishimotonii]|uniref:tRNA-dihydrouridine synthase n=1 Tax=Desulfonema ishimotonii TaxID=45657 RepID=A0A401G1M2_9BACT|nr:tRNA-dihydrouridine synthase family protein [Desulfonema ishimotonii]GBC63097.1 dihydrouridine synthase [Desulfonema ishimotonii]
MSHTLYLAPLRGFTNYIYRNTFIRFFKGIDLAVSPFVPTVSSWRIKDTHIRDVLPENNSGMPVVPQIIGKSAEEFIRMATYLYDLGYDTVNWNLGCPYPMVAKKRRGSGLLPYPDMIDEFLEKTVPAIPNRLSVKTRLGRYTADEISELMPVFNRYPLAELIIHPRLGVQMYDGGPDLDTFAACLERSAHPVVYNGDICRLDDFQRLAGRFRTVDRWMIGRGVLGNPFLPAIIRAGEDTFSDKISGFKKFHDALVDEFSAVFTGPAHVVDRMKGFWVYFTDTFTNTRKVFKKIRKVRNLENYTDIVTRFFNEEAVWGG